MITTILIVTGAIWWIATLAFLFLLLAVVLGARLDTAQRRRRRGW